MNLKEALEEIDAEMVIRQKLNYEMKKLADLNVLQMQTINNIKLYIGLLGK